MTIKTSSGHTVEFMHKAFAPSGTWVKATIHFAEGDVEGWLHTSTLQDDENGQEIANELLRLEGKQNE